MERTDELFGHVVVVTAGTGGIGLTTARALAARPWVAGRDQRVVRPRRHRGECGMTPAITRPGAGRPAGTGALTVAAALTLDARLPARPVPTEAVRV